MDKLLRYGNYYGSVEYSEVDKCWYGKVTGVRSLLSYEGNSMDELTLNFFKAVDDYLNDCKMEGIEPEVRKPF